MGLIPFGKKKPPAMTEQVVAQAVENFMKQQGWAVHREVLSNKAGGARCDLYGLSEGLSWAVEVKTSLSLRVMEQAFFWTGYATAASVATPVFPSPFVKKVLKVLGIGILRVRWNKRTGLVDGVDEILDPEYRPSKDTPYLDQAQQSYSEPGNNRSDFFSPFKKTKGLIVDFLVSKGGGARLKEVVNAVPSHYSSKESFRKSIIDLTRRHVLTEFRIKSVPNDKELWIVLTDQK